MSEIDPPSLGKRQHEALSEFRDQLRRFLHFNEAAARSEGLTPLQYLLLPHIRGFPGRDWATVGELAEPLQLHYHSVMALNSRGEKVALVRPQRSQTDRRQVEVSLLPAGEHHPARLAGLHEAELQSLQGTFRLARITSFNDSSTPDPNA